MAQLKDLIVNGPSRLIGDVNANGTINATGLQVNGTDVSLSGHTHAVTDLPVIPITQGGTGKTSGKEAIENLMISLTNTTTNLDRDSYLTFRANTAGNTEVYTAKVSQIFGKLNSSDVTTALGFTPASSNTWRPIKVNGTNALTDSTSSVNFTGSGVASVSHSNGTITVTVTDIGYAESDVKGVVKLGSDTEQTVAANAVSAIAGRTYAVQMNDSNQLVVNVPWESGSGGSASPYTPHYPTTITGTAAVTSSPYYCARWNVTDNTITSLYDGLMLSLIVPVAGNGSYGTGISINGGDYHPVVYNVNSMISTRYSVGALITAVYNSTQTGALHLNSSSATTVTGCWQVMDYATNTSAVLDSYFRPYASTQAIYRYKLIAQDKDNRMVPIVTTNQTNTTIVEKTPTSIAFKPNKIWVYTSTSTISASGQFAASTIYSHYSSSSFCVYNFNTNIPARSMIYLCGTYNQTTGLFTLDTTVTNSTQYRKYYTSVPYNTANINLNDYLTSGKDYILIGCTYSSQNYLQLFMINTLYHYDGTNLIPYSQYYSQQSEMARQAATVTCSVTNPETAAPSGQLQFVKLDEQSYQNAVTANTIRANTLYIITE